MDKKIIEKPALNILKYILAIFIIMEHTIPMPSYSKNYFTYGLLHMPQRLALPMFFLMSSYFFFISIRKESDNLNKGFRKRIIRLIRLYVIWSIIHFIVNSYDWYISDPLNPGIVQFDVNGMKWYLCYCVLWAKFGVLWFLYSLIIGISLTFIASKFISKRVLAIIAFLIMVFMGGGDAWFGLMTKNDLLSRFYNFFYNTFVSMRGGITWGFLFGIIGYLLVERETTIVRTEKKSNLKKFLCISCLFLYTLEGYITYRLGYPKEYGLWIFSVPASIFIFEYVKEINITDNNFIIMSTFLRNSKLPSLIYFIHILVSFVWDRAFGPIGVDNALYRGVLGFGFVFVFSNYISILIYWLSNFKCFKFLKYLI